MKRQRSRNRGSGGSGGGNGKPQQQNANRAFDSNGPEGVKVRGAAQSVYEKYQQLARDASSAGDRVHAEHYFRTIRTMQPNRPASDILGSRDQFVSGYDMDYEEEPSPEAAAEPYVEPQAAEANERPEPRRDDRNFNRDDRQGEGYRARDDRNRDDRPREDRPRDEYRQRDDRPRDDRPREERVRDDRPREDRPKDDRPRDDRPRDDRPRDERPRDDRPRDERPRERYNRDDRPRERYNRDDRPRPERDPLAVVEPQSTPLITPEAPPAEGARILRGQDGAASEAPAFLQNRAPSPASDSPSDEPKKPRRRKAATPNAESAPADEG